jgi:hypothetical protein
VLPIQAERNAAGCRSTATMSARPAASRDRRAAILGALAAAGAFALDHRRRDTRDV